MSITPYAARRRRNAAAGTLPRRDYRAAIADMAARTERITGRAIGVTPPNYPAAFFALSRRPITNAAALPLFTRRADPVVQLAISMARLADEAKQLPAWKGF